MVEFQSAEVGGKIALVNLTTGLHLEIRAKFRWWRIFQGSEVGVFLL
jgi:hypothetical protein